VRAFRAISIFGAAFMAALLFSPQFAVSSDRVYLEPGDSPSLGPADAPVRIIEFVDYQ